MRSINLALLAIIMLAQLSTVSAQKSLPWSGYIQTRYGDNLDNNGGFSIRRAKLWTKGQTPFNEHLSYKIQTIFRWQNGGALDLQDAYMEYKSGSMTMRFGQMIPDFSLQRSQPDFTIPVVERAKVIDALIPAAESLARDIGAQIILNSSDSNWHGSLGVFNGHGANSSGNINRDYMITARTYYQFGSGKSLKFRAGGSAEWRKSSGVIFKKIYGTKAIYTGEEMRFGVEAALSNEQFKLQGEFIQADLDGQMASGYYALLGYDLGNPYQLVLSSEKFNDLNRQTANDPWYIFGLNYFVSGDKAKWMFDFRTQNTDTKANYQTTLQYQLFFN